MKNEQGEFFKKPTPNPTDIETKKAELKQAYLKLGYEKSHVISAWIKEMRLGNVENALYWLQVMEKAGESWYYVGLRLLIFAYEDGYDIGFACYSTAAWEALKTTKGDENVTFAWTERACSCKKFWECDEGRKREWAWHKGHKDIKNGKQRPIPKYALDKHTGNYDNPDERFSGNTVGRITMMKMYEELGKLDPDNHDFTFKYKQEDFKSEYVEADDHYKVMSSDKMNWYMVSKDLSSCDCKAFTTGKRRPCKHILYIRKELKK